MDTKKLAMGALLLIVLLLGGLFGWYWYLSTHESALNQSAAERGFGATIPTFLGETGSTFENIIQGLGFQDESPVTNEQPPRLWRVLATPGAGLGFISGATSTKLRFLERSTGYLFETDARTGKTERLTNTLIPQINEAFFSYDGLPLIKQIIEGRVSVSSLVLSATTSNFAQLNETALGDIENVAIHPRLPEILALVPDGSGGALIRSQWDGTKPEKVYSSALLHWRIHWLANGIVLSESPASGIPGSAYRLEATGLTPLVRGVPGLTILPRNESDALLLSSDSGLVSLGLRVSAASSTLPLPLRTIAEKCVWVPGRPLAYCAVPNTIPSARFLNDWYQGRVHTTDSWWKIDGQTGAVEQIFAYADSSPLDAESLVINDAGEYIAFRNAYDKSLWVLRIEE